MNTDNSLSGLMNYDLFCFRFHCPRLLRNALKITAFNYAAIEHLCFSRMVSLIWIYVDLEYENNQKERTRIAPNLSNGITNLRRRSNQTWPCDIWSLGVEATAMTCHPPPSRAGMCQDPNHLFLSTQILNKIMNMHQLFLLRSLSLISLFHIRLNSLLYLTKISRKCRRSCQDPGTLDPGSEMVFTHFCGVQIMPWKSFIISCL